MAEGADSKSGLSMLRLLLFLLLGLSVKALQTHILSAAGSALPKSLSRATLESSLAPIPHPDLSNVDPAIKKQIEAAQSDLRSSLETPKTVPGQLAQLYGNLGKLYHAYDFPDAAVA